MEVAISLNDEVTYTVTEQGAKVLRSNGVSTSEGSVRTDPLWKVMLWLGPKLGVIDEPLIRHNKLIFD